MEKSPKCIYLVSERLINVNRVYLSPFWMLNRRGLGQFKESWSGAGQDGAGWGKGGAGEELVLSLGVPFDLLQPSEHFPIQDGGHNLRTKDYLALAPHKIRLYCWLP